MAKIMVYHSTIRETEEMKENRKETGDWKQEDKKVGMCVMHSQTVRSVVELPSCQLNGGDFELKTVALAE